MNKKIIGSACIAVAIAAIISSCGDGTTRSTGMEFSRNMYDPIGYNPDQQNSNFANRITAQTPPAGTVPIGFERFPYDSSIEGYQAASDNYHNPLERTAETLKQGEVLYLRFCQPCHGESGNGDGSIVKLEKYPAPPSYSTGNSSRGGLMKDLTDGKIYHTIYHGLNLMGPHASLITPEDRWKIVMHVKELQKR